MVSKRLPPGVVCSANLLLALIGDIAVVTAVADSDDFDLTHYYIFKADESNIYMGTYTVSTPSVGELRWIARLVELDQGFKEGDVSETANGDAIEAEDVFLVGDETRSKVRPVLGDLEMTYTNPNNYDSSTRPSASSTTMCTAATTRVPQYTPASCRPPDRARSPPAARSSATSTSSKAATTPP